MVAYLCSREGHAAAHWCPDCGALCWRTYLRGQAVDAWQEPGARKRAPAAKAKRPR